MKERTPQDQAWNDQKERNAQLNRALADNILYHGQFWRRSVTAGRIMRSFLRDLNNPTKNGPNTSEPLQ